jgi:tRNA(fMet)-specific endonuclease VapC
MKGKYNLDQKLDTILPENIFISEITLAELKFGVEKSEAQSKNRKTLHNFLSGVQVLPIIQCLDIFAMEKARLSKMGIIIDDFDLLIGASALANELIMVTNNVGHLSRLKGIHLEDWTK